MTERRYTRDEVDAILGRALRSAQDEGMTHDELVAAAREVGVSPEAIAKAAAEVERERAVERETAALRRGQIRAFYSHLASYLIVCSGLVALNLLLGGVLWFPWVLVGWGVGLAMHLRHVVSPDTERLASRARMRQARRERREARRRRDRELEAHARELGVAVTKGLATVAKAAAERIEQDLHSKPPAGAPPKDAPRVRVERDVRVGEPVDDGDREASEPEQRRRRT
jgi:hypothetical protein